MRFYTPPENQGQIVEVSYAATPAGLIERIYDRSDRSTSYSIARWTQKLSKWWDSSGPWNTTPPHARYRNLTERELAEIEDED